MKRGKKGGRRTNLDESDRTDVGKWDREGGGEGTVLTLRKRNGRDGLDGGGRDTSLSEGGEKRDFDGVVKADRRRG